MAFQANNINFINNSVSKRTIFWLKERSLPLLVEFVSFVRVEHIFRVRVAFRRVLFPPPSQFSVIQISRRC